MFRNLGEFISALDEKGELKRIAAGVSPDLEVTEIADRVVKSGGPALLFENVGDSGIPLLINAFGTRERLAFALGVEKLADLGKKVEGVREFLEKRPSGWMDRLKMLPGLGELADMMPKTVSGGPCREVTIKDAPSLDILPALKCWPDDGGRYLTLPLVFTKDPETGGRNCGIYRMQIYDSATTGMHWHPTKGGAQHFRKLATAEDKRLEVAVAIGASPAVNFAAAAPMPEGVDEMILAGFLRGKAVEMTAGVTVDIEVPAESEIVLEGYVDAGELRREGPFGDHTGYYSLADDFPVFHLTAITHRKNPVYQAMVVGRPPMEDCFLGEAIGELFLPLLKMQFPEIVDVNMPFEGVFHNLVLVSIEKRYPGHARKIMHAFWGMGQLATTKTIVVVDSDVDVRDAGEVAWKALNHIDPERDIEFTHGPLDILDHASRLPGYGSKAGIDATRKWPEEGFAREWPDEIKMPREIKDLVSRRWPEYGL